jgi:hypothetical protein
MFHFSVHPAAITVTDGVRDAWTFLVGSWRKWLPAVLVLVAIEFLTFLLFVPDVSSLYHIDTYTGKLVWSPNATDKVPLLVLGYSLVAVVSLVVTWILAATAIGGLRNRPVTAEHVVFRGLLSLATSILLGLAAGVAFVVVTIVFVLAPLLGLLALLGLIVGAIYVWIRLSFFSLAIFDGFGPIEGLRESWRLSKGAVLRLLGWGLMASLILFGVEICVSFLALFFRAIGGSAASQATTYSLISLASGFTVFLMAALYESQRARNDPSLYPYAPMPTYPGLYAPGPYPRGPYAAGPYPPGPYAAGPYTPAPYPPGPYAGGPYPAGPYAPGSYPPPPYPPGPYPGGPYQPGPWGPQPYAPAPGWPPAPGVAPAWPPYPPGAPGWPAYPYPAPAGPAAEPVWKSDEPEAAPPLDSPEPPEPPASS